MYAKTNAHIPEDAMYAPPGAWDVAEELTPSSSPLKRCARGRTMFNPQSSILNPQSSIFNPQSSIVNPQSTLPVQPRTGNQFRAP